jgi:hypothetical protein
VLGDELEVFVSMLSIVPLRDEHAPYRWHRGVSAHRVELLRCRDLGVASRMQLVGVGHFQLLR